MARQPVPFDFNDRMKRLSDLGDRLEAFSEAVDFEMFRVDLEATLNHSDRVKGGRPPLTRSGHDAEDPDHPAAAGGVWC